MPRSASTWSYNVCLRMLSLNAPPASIYADYNENLLEAIKQLQEEHRHLLLKSHTLDETGRRMLQLGVIKAIYTYRDPFDAIVSFMRMFNQPFEVALSAIRCSFDAYGIHEQSGSCILPYECIVHSPLEAVKAVSAYLRLNIDENLLVRIASDTGRDAMKEIADRLEFAPPESLVQANGMVYDRNTLLHKNHIRDGRSGYGRGMLSEEEQQIVERTFPQWLTLRGGADSGVLDPWRPRELCTGHAG